MQNALKQLDLLSEPVSFHIDNQKTFKTVFGGVLSIISLAIVVFFLHSSFENCLNKSVVDTKSNKKYNIDPTPIVFNKNKFMFAIGIRQQDKNDFLQNPFFNISLTKVTYIKNNTNQIPVASSLEIQLEPCTDLHWRNISQAQDFVNLYNKTEKQFLCLPESSNFELVGAFGNEIFTYLRVKVVPCNNKAPKNGVWDPVCANQDTIDKYLKKYGFFQFQMYHNSIVFNVDQPQEYYMQYLNNIYYNFIPLVQSTQADLFFQNSQIETNQSVLPISDTQKETFLQYDYQSVQNVSGGKNILNLYIRASYNSIQYKREYKKLQHLLSDLGGFLQLTLVFFSIIIRKYNVVNYLFELSKKIYFKHEKPWNKKNFCQQKQFFSQMSPVYKINLKKEDSVQNQNILYFENNTVKENNKGSANENLQIQNDKKKDEDILQLPKSNRNNFQDSEQIQEYDVQQLSVSQQQKSPVSKQKQRIKENKMQSLDFQFYLYFISFKKIFNNERNLYIQNAIDDIHKDLDIRNLLINIQQIKQMVQVVKEQQVQISQNHIRRTHLEIQEKSTKNIKKDEISHTNILEQLNQLQQQRQQSKFNFIHSNNDSESSSVCGNSKINPPSQQKQISTLQNVQINNQTQN